MCMGVTRDTDRKSLVELPDIILHSMNQMCAWYRQIVLSNNSEIRNVFE